MEENSEEENLQGNCVMLMERTLTDLWETDVLGCLLSALYLQPFDHRYFVGNPV